MRLSEMIVQAIIELRYDGIDEPTTNDIQRMIFTIYGIWVECEDITRVRSDPPNDMIRALVVSPKGKGNEVKEV